MHINEWKCLGLTFGTELKRTKEQNPWRIKVPIYDPNIDYPKGALTFPFPHDEKFFNALWDKKREDKQKRKVRKSAPVVTMDTKALLKEMEELYNKQKENTSKNEYEEN